MILALGASLEGSGPGTVRVWPCARSGHGVRAWAKAQIPSPGSLIQTQTQTSGRPVRQFSVQ
eukprot:1654784-Alexandrium_andersonii.AAC.1